MTFVLPTPQLIEIQGKDALAFANAQLCNDVFALEIGTWQYNAWLNPQGRVHAFFLLLRPQPDTLLMLLRGGVASEICADLAHYKFRSKVSIQPLRDWRAQGISGVQAVTEYTDADFSGHESDAKKLLQSPGLLGITQPGSEPRLLLLTAPQSEPAIANTANADDMTAWTLADIRAGVPELAITTRDEFLPQALGLERLHAVSFNKGCYPGQEVVARVHFKGGNKRHLYLIEIATDQRPSAGSAIHVIGNDQQPAGLLLQCAPTSPTQILALAVLREDTAEQNLHIPGAGTISLATKC